MGTNSEVGWTNHTWNGWIACHKVSEGCAHCYMYRQSGFYSFNPSQVRRTKDPTFYAPLKWKEPALVFTCSWSDFFIDEADKWRDDAWDVIRQTPHLTYQILTKRPERIADHLPDDWGENGYPNVWLGTSVELNKYRSRIEHLVKVPAPIHFLSLEPLLGPIDLIQSFNWSPGHWESYGARIDWIIVGGESGKGGRLMDASWVKELRDYATAKDYKGDRPRLFFLKQWGGTKKCKCHGVYGCKLLDGEDWREIPQMVASL